MIRYLDIPGVSQLLGELGAPVGVRTLYNYKRAERLPMPDAMIGEQEGWLPETIRAWQAARPGRGAGGGRPRKSP